MFLAIRGAFNSEDDEFDSTKYKLAAIMRPQNGLRETMDAVALENVTTRGIACVVGSAIFLSIRTCNRRRKYGIIHIALQLPYPYIKGTR